MGLRLLDVELGWLAFGKVQHQIADGQRFAVDRRRGHRGDPQVDDVLDVGRFHLDTAVLDLHVDASEVLEGGAVAEHLDARQLFHQFRQRPAQRLALAGQQEVDDTEGVLLIERVEECEARRVG